MILLFAVHSGVSALTYYFEPAETVFEGSPYFLIKDGAIDHQMLRECHITQNDLISAVRRHAHTNSLQNVKHAILETNGDISIILK